MGRLRDQVVVLTGASSGIGRATALAFAKEGAVVVLAARRVQALEDVAQACRREGVQALAVPTDVTDEAQVQALAQKAAESFGRIDVWVNNAAVSLFGRFSECPPEAYRRVLETNLFGYIHGARAVLPFFHEQGRGVLINNASVFAKAGAPYLSAYVTSKWGLLGFAESLRQEVRRDGISVCTVLPASIDTPIFQSAANFSGWKVKPVEPITPPERVAEVIVACARRPRRERVVGRSGWRMLAWRRLWPALAERQVARMVDREHFEAWPAPPSLGNVFRPSAALPAQATGNWMKPSQRTVQRVLTAALPRLGARLAVAAGLLLAPRALRALGAGR
jgi:NAD(P)-dependent dehydrogenase (short-subunit alcohol dehydrogenase family)